MHEDFDIDRLAAYLHFTPVQVTRLADRGKLPGRRIGGKWRFAHAAIHHWLEEKIGISDKSELVHVEGVLQRAEQGTQWESLSVSQVLASEAIEVPLKARTRNSVITAMVELAARTGSLWDDNKMAEAVRAREELHPTALDNGVALLHPRRPMASILGEPVIAFGRTHHGIPFGGRAGHLTDVFFLICSTGDGEHLRLLARLTRMMLVDSDFVPTLRGLETPNEVRGFILEAESELDD